MGQLQEYLEHRCMTFITLLEQRAPLTVGRRVVISSLLGLIGNLDSGFIGSRLSASIQCFRSLDVRVLWAAGCFMWRCFCVLLHIPTCGWILLVMALSDALFHLLMHDTCKQVAIGTCPCPACSPVFVSKLWSLIANMSFHDLIFIFFLFTFCLVPVFTHLWKWSPNINQ